MNIETRKIAQILQSKPVMEGAGVLLKRVFGFYEENTFDPFLLLDNFGSDNPKDYIAGFPWHPHRGIETVTYMLDGVVEHGDSMGNSGTISSGDVQWMTAGSGIIHQEMPKPSKGTMRGFQLWSNLPAANKMMKPRYQDVPSSVIPTIQIGDGADAKIIAGELEGTTGPVKEIISDPLFFDITVESGKSVVLPVHDGYTVFAYVYDGDGFFDERQTRNVSSGQLVHLVEGNRVNISAGESKLNCIFISGKLLKEPVAWRGPIVMNTQEELDIAFREYRRGTFIKK